MAEVVVDVKVDSTEITEAEKHTEGLKNEVNEVTAGFNEMGLAIENSTNQAVEGVKNIDDSTQKARKSTGLLAGGFRVVGAAIKAAGIGLVIGAVTALTAAFTRNRKIMDAVDLTFRTVGQVFSQIVDALVQTYDTVTQNTEGFNALGRIMKGVLDIAITPYKLAFFGIKLAIQEARLAWEQSPFGSGDQQTINDLTLSVLETKAAIIEAGKEALNAGLDIATSLGEAVGEIGAIATEASNNLSNVSLEAARATAQANKQAQDAAIIAQAEAGRLVAQFERQAEIQRQIRDDEFNSIESRQQANERLAQILDEQEKQLLRQADAVIAGAQAEAQKNDTLENQAAVIDAIAAKEQVLADIEGKRSEQKTNAFQLEKDRLAIEQLISDAEVERARRGREFDAEQIQNEEIKLQQKLRNLTLSETEALAANQREIDSFNAGTEARAQAEQERLNIIQEFAQQRTLIESQAAQANVRIAQEEQKTKINALSQYGSALQNVTSLIGQETSEGKGISVAASLINTYASIAGQLSAFSKVPVPGYAIAQAIATGAAGFAAVRNILKVKVPKGGGTSGGNTVPSGSGVASGSPNFAGIDFSFLGDGGQAAASDFESLDQEQGQIRGVRAYVTSTEITGQQNIDQRVTELASLNGG